MFITFEGLDGSGKTTQLGETAAFLRQHGKDVLLTREPGGTHIGDDIREILLKKSEQEVMHPRTELLLFCASRAQLVATVIRPHLEKGGVVISDRFYDSTYAYQGYGHGLDLAMLKTIISFATGNLTPDLTLYFDIAPEEALRRRRQASLFGEEFNRLDAMALAFRQRVYDGYEALIAESPERWTRLDAAQPVKAVTDDVLALMAEHFALSRKGKRTPR